MKERIPKIGVPGILPDGESRIPAPKVTLHILWERGVMVEKRTVEGSEPTVAIKFITRSDEEDEQAVLDETKFV
ncbi:MAG: hypothetical protein AAB481_04020 [Patescibacteria group bacterium]